ncbi:MAG: NIPSNAP family protein [Proteobacteria bacterium]|nr:NIPSNAP family protein [Pseudomonadota bacterium]
MTAYLHVTLEVDAAGMARFIETMGEAVSLLEGWGWKLQGAFIQRTGKLNTVIDVWELENFAHFDLGLQKFRVHPRFAAIKKALDETVKSETIVFADRAPYMR